MTEFVMEWDDWIELTDAEQEAVRRRYERPGSEALPGSLSVEEQRQLLLSMFAGPIMTIQFDALGLRRMGKWLCRDRRKLPPTAQSPQDSEQ